MTLRHHQTLSPVRLLAKPGRPRAALLALTLAGLLLVGCGGSSEEADPPEPVAAPEAESPAAGSDDPVDPLELFDAEAAFADLRGQVAIGPRPAGSDAAERTARYIRARLSEAGAGGAEIASPRRNVVASIRGTGEGRVVIGAHYDTVKGVPGFVGANDGASGVAVVLELARALVAERPAPTVDIALFDAEEARPGRSFDADGTRGSRQYAEGLADPQAIDAMILFDMVGDCDLAIPREARSDAGLYEAIAAEAERLGIDGVFGGETSPISDDHVPFLQRGIPAVDLIDFTYGPGVPPGEFWHTDEDDLDKVCAESLEAVGAPVLSLLIDGSLPTR